MTADLLPAKIATKKCTKCSEVKALSEFGVRTSSKDGLSHQCKPCVRARNAKYYRADREKSAAQRARNYQKNRTRLLEYRRVHYRENRDQYSAWHAATFASNPEAYRKSRRDWARNNRGKINAYIRKRYAEAPEFKQKELQRRMLRRCLSQAGIPKSAATNVLLGYTPDRLAARLEVQFKPGMAWSNYGEWQIDHKIPVSHFLAKGEVRPHVINALCNLQPLWARENLTKRDRHPLRG